mgnify:FL=1
MTINPEWDVEPSAATVMWQNRNPWYGEGDYHLHTRTALRIHNSLIEEGVDSDDTYYYQELNRRLRRGFPELQVGDIDVNALSWSTKNPWHRESRYHIEWKTALQINKSLLDEDVDSNEAYYYRELNRRLRQNFPELEVRDIDSDN